MPRKKAYLGALVLVLLADAASKELAEALLAGAVITNSKDPVLWSLVPCLAISGLALWRLDSLPAWALGALAGGWIANTLDRALFGPVSDFIPLPGGYVANLADAAIWISAAVLLWASLRFLLAALRGALEARTPAVP